MLCRLEEKATSAESTQALFDKTKGFVREMLRVDLACGVLGYFASTPDIVNSYIKAAVELLDACDQEGAMQVPDIVRIIRLAVAVLVIGGDVPRGAYADFASLETTVDDPGTGLWSGVRLGAGITTEQLADRLRQNAPWLQSICYTRLGTEFPDSVMLCAAVSSKRDMVIDVENTPTKVDNVDTAVDATLARRWSVTCQDVQEVHSTPDKRTDMPGWGGESYPTAYSRWDAHVRCQQKRSSEPGEGLGGLGGGVAKRVALLSAVSSKGKAPMMSYANTAMDLGGGGHQQQDPPTRGWQGDLVAAGLEPARSTVRRTGSCARLHFVRRPGKE